MNTPKVLFLFAMAAVGSASAQNIVDRIIDRAIGREQALLATLQGTKPVAETYIQDLANDTDFGAVPVNDHYFVGRIDFSHGINQTSYLPKASDGSKLDLFSRFFTIQYLPKGFAQMMMIDGSEFDRAHYDFHYLRREFLGDVRAIVFSVTPRPGTGIGRFEGNIWVEDKGDNIVRFNGTYNGSSS